MAYNPFDSPAILYTRLDLTPAGQEPGLAWLDDDFIPATMHSIGATSAMRLRCLAGEPVHIVVYGGDSRPAADTPRPMPRTADMLDRWMRNYESRWYASASGSGPLGGARLMNVITTEVDPSAAETFNDWYRDVHVPEILACPGWLSSRRFSALDDAGYFLAAYELSDATTPFDSERYRAAVGWDGHEYSLVGYHGFRIYEVVRAF